MDFIYYIVVVIAYAVGLLCSQHFMRVYIGTITGMDSTRIAQRQKFATPIRFGVVVFGVFLAVAMPMILHFNAVVMVFSFLPLGVLYAYDFYEAYSVSKALDKEE